MSDFKQITIYDRRHFVNMRNVDLITWEDDEIKIRFSTHVLELSDVDKPRQAIEVLINKETK